MIIHDIFIFRVSKVIMEENCDKGIQEEPNQNTELTDNDEEFLSVLGRLVCLQKV